VTVARLAIGMTGAEIAAPAATTAALPANGIDCESESREDCPSRLFLRSFLCRM
jgi:hypothetical protein